MREKVIIILLSFFSLLGFRALADETNLVGEWNYKAISCVAPDESPSSIDEDDYIYYQSYNKGIVFNADGTSVEKSLSFSMSPYICLSADLSMEYTVDGVVLHRNLVDLQVKMESCYNPGKPGDLTPEDIKKLESFIESEKQRKLVALSFEISGDILYIMYSGVSSNFCDEGDNFVIIYEKANLD